MIKAILATAGGFSLLVLWTAATVASAQRSVAFSGPSSAPLSYDIVSIRPAKPDANFRGSRPLPDETEIILPLRGLVAYAYGFRQELVFGGPKWSNTTVFDVIAKMDDGSRISALGKLSSDQRASLLRPVLASRFGLKIHKEVRVLPVYDLILTKKGLGPGFQPHAPNRPANGMAVAGDNFSGNGVGMPLFTKVLSKVLSDTVGRPILDKTRLTGTYDFMLRWRSLDGPPESGTSRPDIFTAIQEQLGLKLQPADEQVETLIIDSADYPSVN